jgi:hypothetical protein
MDLSPGPPAVHHTMDEGSWTPMQSEGGRPLVLSGDGVRDWFNGELDRLEKRRERGIFSAAQVNQPPATYEPPNPRNPETPKPRNPEAPQSQPTGSCRSRQSSPCMGPCIGDRPPALTSVHGQTWFCDSSYPA